jgi:hypothetical protein
MSPNQISNNIQQCKGISGLTSTKSHPQTFPCSSPHTTVASAAPKHPLTLYSFPVCPLNVLSTWPVARSSSLMCESRVVIRRVCKSAVGTTDVIGSVETIAVKYYLV